MWPSEIPKNSELFNYYQPLFDIKATWDPSVYMGSPLLFQFVAGVKNMVNLSDDGVIVITRFLFIILTTLAVRRLYVAIFNQATVSNHAKSNVTLRTVELSAHLTGIFFLFDYTFSYLIASDQLKQLIGMPFLVLAVTYLLEKRRLLFVLFSFLSVASHYLFGPVLLIAYLLKLVVNWRFFKSKYSMIFLPLVALLSVVLVKAILEGMTFFGDKVNHPVPTGLMDGLLFRPGAMLAVAYYLFFILTLCIYAKKDYANPRLKFILMLVVLMLGFSKVNILGVQFVEPARFYSLISPFFAILVTRVYLLSRTNFDRTAIISAVILYNCLPMQFGEKHNHLLSVLSEPAIGIYEINLNQEFSLTILIIGILSLGPLKNFALKFVLPSLMAAKKADRNNVSKEQLS